MHVLGPDIERFTEIWRRCSAERGIPMEEWAVPSVYKNVYRRLGVEPRACHPRDILDHFLDIAAFVQAPTRLTPELLDRACRAYFLDDTEQG
jgi:hypothetical protein